MRVSNTQENHTLRANLPGPRSMSGIWYAGLRCRLGCQVAVTSRPSRALPKRKPILSQLVSCGAAQLCNARVGKALSLEASRHRLCVRRYARCLQQLAGRPERLPSRIQAQSPTGRSPQRTPRLGDMCHAQRASAAPSTRHGIPEVHGHPAAHRELQPQRFHRTCSCTAAGGQQTVAEGGSPAERCARTGHCHAALCGLHCQQSLGGGCVPSEQRPLELPLLRLLQTQVPTRAQQRLNRFPAKLCAEPCMLAVANTCSTPERVRMAVGG